MKDHTNELMVTPQCSDALLVVFVTFVVVAHVQPE